MEKEERARYKSIAFGKSSVSASPEVRALNLRKGRERKNLPKAIYKTVEMDC
jgi:hypothetical protein